MEIWVKYRVLLVALLALGGAMVVPEGEAAPVAAENREALVKQYLQKALVNLYGLKKRMKVLKKIIVQI